jgi:hypothetical protein
MLLKERNAQEEGLSCASLPTDDAHSVLLLELQEFFCVYLKIRWFRFPPSSSPPPTFIVPFAVACLGNRAMNPPLQL